MCGHVGIAQSTILGKDGGKFLKQALFAGALRGKDSTGIATIDKDSKVSVFKRALCSNDFLSSQVGSRGIYDAEGSFVAIGHNRATTMGLTTDDTAHPFHFGRFVGAHNGTISQHKTLLPVSKYSIDSQNLIASFTEAGNLHDVLKEVHSGAYAVVVYDTKDDKLLFCRNNERPLHLLVNENNILWASEAAMLYWLADRNGFLDKTSELISVPTETVLSYDCNNMEFDDPVKFTTVSKPAYNYNYNSYSNFGNSSSKSNSTKLMGGEVQGVPFDFYLTEHEITATLNISSSGSLFYPVEFSEHSKGSPKGTVKGYVYDVKTETLFPAICYSVCRDKYFQAHEENKLLVTGRIVNGNFTKEGNVVSLTIHGVGIAEDDKAPGMWDDRFDFLYGEDSVQCEWSAGESGSVILKKMVSDIKDLGVRKAYVLKKKDKYVSKKNLEDIHFGSTELVPSSKKSQDAGVVPGPEGPISEAFFSLLSQNGCAVCGTDVFVEDAPDVMWIKWNSGELNPICKSCCKNESSFSIVEDFGATRLQKTA